MIKQFKDTLSDKWIAGCWVILLAMACLAVLTASNYGDSWDEQIRFDAGEQKLAYYKALFSGNMEEVSRIGSIKDKYPGFHDLNLALIRRLSPFSNQTTGNLFSSFLGILGLAGAMRLGHVLGGPKVAFLGGLLLATLPSYYGHLYINPKDIPFAFGYVWALVFITQWLKADSATPWRTVILAGIAIGVTAASRIGGLVLMCYLALFLGLKLIAYVRESGISPVLGDFIRKQAPRFALAGVLAIFILLIYWPSGQFSPFTRADETLQAITHFDWNMPVLFEGSYFEAPDLPFYYIIKMILVKVPVVILLLSAAGAVMAVRFFREDGLLKSNKKLPLVLLIFSILFPVLYAIFRDSVLYNGLRHFLFILPPVAIFAAWGALQAHAAVEEKSPRMVRPAMGLCALLILLPVVQMVRLHPYQYIYYNELAGGTAGAARRYETDYWCTVYKELADEFYSHLRETRPAFSRPEVVVNTEHVTWLLAPYLEQSQSLPIRVVRSQPEVDDYYISSTSWLADRFYHGNPVVVVECTGIPLGVVKDRRGLSPEQRQLGYGQ
ncbi:MAG: hypothetical protein AB3N63_15400 [Puniceicoccaceae bacterium]